MLTLQFHAIELKFRFYYLVLNFFLTFFVSYFYIESLVYLYTLPFLKFQLFSNKTILTNFIFTNLSEAFICYVYFAFSVAFYFTIFLLIQSLFSFLKMGLFEYEKKFLNKFINLAFIYINLVLFLFINYALPIFLNFFLSFERVYSEKLFTIRYEAKLLDYLILNNNFIIFAFVIFLIPLLLFYSFENDLISLPFFFKNRRLVVFFFFLIGGIFSPPDIYSQLLIALPLFFCFELVIFLSCLKIIYFSKFYKNLIKKTL